VALGETIEQALAQSGARWRRVADGEWGLTVPAGGFDLHVGLALRGGMLAAQAEVLAAEWAGAIGEHALLRRNRTLRLVRFSHTAAGAVYVQGELPAAAVTVAEVDRLLGLLVAAAEEVRPVARRPAADG
jgi:Putative bacterial sensory transduction regulator